MATESDPMSTTRDAQSESARRARVDAIRDGATVRAALGILWQHRRDLIGQHLVWTYDRDRGAMLEYTGATVDEAIDAARAGRAAG